MNIKNVSIHGTKQAQISVYAAHFFCKNENFSGVPQGSMFGPPVFFSLYIQLIYLLLTSNLGIICYP